MNESKIVVEVVKPEITIARGEVQSSDLQVLIDGEPLVSIHYVYPWIDNAGQWSIAEKIAKMLKGE